VRNPSPARDALLRSYAEAAFEKLLAWAWKQDPKYLEWSLSTLYVERGGQLFPLRVIPWWKVDASLAPKHPLRGVKVLVGGNSPDAAMGSLTDDPNHGLLLTLWGVLGTPTGLAKLGPGIRNARGIFIHEYVHLLDRLRIQPEAWRRMSRGRRVGPGRHDEAYFLSPQEFNAYYQEGFNRFEDSFRSLLAQRPVLESQGARMTPELLRHAIRRSTVRRRSKFGESVWEKLAIDAEQYLDWDRLRFRLDDYWHGGFLEFVRKDPAMKRRFLKRLRLDFESWKARQMAWLGPLWAVVADLDQGVVR
jgi:hypothetical protein